MKEDRDRFIKRAKIVGAGMVVLTGAVVAISHNATRNFGEQGSGGGRTTWLNKETGEETDYDPRLR